MDETIVALSSAVGGGDVGGGVRAIVRVSGADARAVAGAVVVLPAGARGRGYYGGVDLRGWGEGNGLAGVMVFEGPRSFTGEDVVEVHLPNSGGLVGWVIERMLGAGLGPGWRGGVVRMAGPGEFSARAFLNGKMDLTEAEGIAATIAAANDAQLRAAASLRAGDLHRWVERVVEELADVLALVEAGIDFVEEEDIRFIDAVTLGARVAALAAHVQGQLETAVRVDRLDDLPTVVFVGKPNVGKSSLINALAGQERSLVSAVAGTTRDMLAVTMRWGREGMGGAGGVVRLVDVPGEEPGVDELRRKMMEARSQALLDADLVVEVVARGKGMEGGVEEGFAARCVRVENKVDLVEGETAGEVEGDWRRVSARTGQNVGELREAIGRMVARGEVSAGGRLVLNHRHRAILREAHGVLAQAVVGADYQRHPELVAAELRRGLDLLGEITGAVSPDAVLGRVFATFCVGK